MIRQKKISPLSTFCLSLLFFFFFSSPVFAAMYTYTGSSQLINDGDGHLRIKFLTSGTFTPSNNMIIDAFLVGGGGGGAMSNTSSGVATGAGGYTSTYTNIMLSSGTGYPIYIGAGGIGGYVWGAAGSTGETSTAFNHSAAGGGGGYAMQDSPYTATGGSGGTGGSGSTGGSVNGASDGANGNIGNSYGVAGTGQGTTTREFGEVSGTLYSGSGGGTREIGTGFGGDGGGGTKSAGTANTGGGGAAISNATSGPSYIAYAGGSGIVVIRFTDSTSPTCGSWSPSSSSWKTSGVQEFTLSGSTDSGGSNINVAGGSCTTDSSNGNTCDVVISDGAGNTTVCTSPVNRVDSTLPVCGTWSPTSSWQRSNSTKTFTLSSSTDDGGAGISTAGGSCTTSSTNNSTCTVQIRDNAYNYTSCVSPPNRIDTTAPTCGTWSPTSSPWKTSGTSTFTLSGSTDNTGGSGINVSGGSCTTGASNNYKCSVTITDIAGNTTSCTSPSNRLDTTAPTCGNWSPTSSPWKTSAATQTFDLSDSYDFGSGINVSGGSCTTANTHDSVCTITISDQVGNTSTCTSPINRIDTQLPYCGSWNPSWPTLKKSGTQTFTLSSSTDYDSSGISISGGSCTTAGTDGATCTVNISDRAGNTVACTSPGNRIDNISPTIVSVKITQASNSATVSWTTSNESAYSKMKYGLTEGLEFITNISTSFSSSASQTLSSLLSCTTYFYQPIAIDEVGNESLGEIKNFTTAGCASSQADPSVLSQSASSVNNDVGGSLALATTTEQITLNLPANFKNDLGTTSPVVFQVKQLDQEQTINSVSVPSDDFLEDNNNHSNELINSIFDLKAYLNEDERLSEFDEPIMVSISYTDAQIAGIDLSTLSIYRYDGSIWQRLTTTIDKENKKLTAYTNHFSLFAAFGQTEQISENNSSSSNNSSNQTSASSGPSVCTDSKPLFISNLFQINTTKNTTKIFFSPQADTNKYYISFSSKNSNAEEHGEEVTLLKEGVQSHTIYNLKPNTIYYIKVRGQNGCMTGDWSNILKFKTDSKVYYKNSTISNKITSTIKKITNNLIDQPTQKSTQTPIVETNQNKNTQTTSTTSKIKKKCFLWWCW